MDDEIRETDERSGAQIRSCRVMEDGERRPILEATWPPNLDPANMLFRAYTNRTPGTPPRR
jgi:hypothetical protein